jgi:rSAM/selenodomain-associated transferase 2
LKVRLIVSHILRKSSFKVKRLKTETSGQRRSWIKESRTGMESMVNRSEKTELSIIVPVFNEAVNVAGFLKNLARQRNVDFEVVFSDGGSADETCVTVEEAAKNLLFPVKIICGDRGRGRQMNRGACEAEGDLLLFLHVDSLFDDENALRKGIDALLSATRAMGCEQVAGRFELRFRRRTGRFPQLYFYHESKALLNRSGCIHGDQGFMLARSFFFSAGPFDLSVPVLEDTRFAESVRVNGMWVLFPSTITTSARRFETEGPVRREILNSIIMTLGAIGREEFLREMPQVYSSQCRSGKLLLFPIFSRIRGLLSELQLRERISFWYGCGTYVAANSWQLLFLLDVRRNYRRGGQPGEENSCLDCFDRYAGGLIGRFPVRLAACLLVWVFFHVSFLCFLVTEKAWKGSANTPD